MKAVTFLRVAVEVLVPMKKSDLCTSCIIIMWNLPVHATAMRFIGKYHIMCILFSTNVSSLKYRFLRDPSS